MASADADLQRTGVDQEITRLFRVRRTLLQMLRDRGYAVGEGETDLGMSRSAFEDRLRLANLSRESLTMLKQKRDDPSMQIYVFFHKQAKVGVKDIREYTERMERDRVFQAILVVYKDLTPGGRKGLEMVQSHFRLEWFLENELQVNITEHILVPKHEILTPEEKKALLKRYKLKQAQLPRILWKDPVARYYGLQNGQVVKITRPSETAGRYVSYRLCVGGR